MKSNVLVLVIVAAAALFVAPSLFNGGGGSTPVQPQGPDMRPVFGANKNAAEGRQHALLMGSICRSIASQIEFDGQQTKPLYTSGVQLDNLRLRIRIYRLNGWSFMTQYPTLSTTIEQFLNERLTKSGGPITPEQRRNWVESFQALAKCCDYAADN